MLLKNELTRHFNRKKIQHINLTPIEGNSSILVSPSLGGRLIGVFVDDVNLVWTNPDIGKDWNSGGQRTWFAPEWGSKSIYAKGDQTTWSVPKIMDPGNYKISDYKNDEYIEMKNDFDVITTDGMTYSLTFIRRIGLPNAGKLHLPDNFDGKKVEIEFSHSIGNRGEATIESEIGLWSILQVVPPGKIIVSLKDCRSDDWFNDKYYESIPRDRIHKIGNHAIIFVDGKRRYKLGFQPDFVKGEIAYLSELPDGRYYIILKTFNVVQDSIYVDKPFGDSISRNGDAIQIYNHSEGGKMAFAELETHAPAAVLPYNHIQSFSINLTFLVFVKNELQRVLNEILNFGSNAILREIIN